MTKLLLNPLSGNFDYVNDTIRTGNTRPVSAAQGMLFYNIDDAILYIYVNGSWVSIGSGTPPTPTPGVPVGLLWLAGTTV